MKRRSTISSSGIQQPPSVDSSEEISPLPSRRASHPSNKRKLDRYFYNTLMFLFVILTIGLTIWGIYFRNGVFE